MMTWPEEQNRKSTFVSWFEVVQAMTRNRRTPNKTSKRDNSPEPSSLALKFGSALFSFQCSNWSSTVEPVGWVPTSRICVINLEGDWVNSLAIKSSIFLPAGVILEEVALEPLFKEEDAILSPTPEESDNL